MFLPTVALDTLKETVWDSWIATIQGPVMGRCDVTPTQRRLLLDIALTYRAFTSGTAGVPDIWYTNFIRTLINITRTHDNQSIHEPLLNLTAALRVLLPNVRPSQPSPCSLTQPNSLLLRPSPQDVFNALDIPPVSDDIPAADPISPAGQSEAPPSGRAVPALTTAGFNTSPDDVPAPDPSLDDIYRTVPCRTADEGDESDGETLPSLVTVVDSSDGEDA